MATDDETQQAVDYLGAQAPLRIQQRASLPTGAAPIAATGPVGTTRGGGGAALGAGPNAPASMGERVSIGGVPTALQVASRIADVGGKVGALGAAPSHAMPEETRGAFLAQRAGERLAPALGGIDPGLAAMHNEQLPAAFFASELGEPGAAGSLATGAGASAGTSAASKLPSAGQALGTAGSIFGAVTAQEDYSKGLHAAAAAANFIPVYGQAIAAVLEAANFIAGLFENEGSWAKFPGKLAETLQLEESSNQGLADAIANAGSAADIGTAIGNWKQKLGGHIGGFGAGSGAFEIPNEPGAGGSKHEGGLTANFDPETAALRQLVQAKMNLINQPAPAASPTPKSPDTPPPAAAVSPTGGFSGRGMLTTPEDQETERA